MNYHLTTEDIAFIAELRTEGVRWKLIANIFNRKSINIKESFYKRMKAGK